MRRLDNIDLRLLRVFATLAEAGSFRDAQIALNLSQPTLSAHLAELERRLGGQLCERGRRGFRLTQFGEITLASAQQLFADIDAFGERLDQLGGGLSGRLRVGIVDGVISNPSLGLQRVIDQFMNRAPNVFIDLQLGTPHDLEQAITDNRRDLVIGPLSQKAPGVAYVLIHREAHGLYCGNGHPLFDVAGRDITREMIDRSLFSVRRYRHFDDLYRVGHPRASGAVTQQEAQVMMLLSNRFIGFLPCHIGDEWAERGRMRRVPHEAYEFESSHFVAVRQADAGRELVQMFVDEVVRQAHGS
jgi:DNA-binding transcriptional LysR family regulator